ncbi:hypothetical protein [Winogradskyella sp.]|uniref:hypothetical protein n=1 Tax=Winogradskyella sp. TaxID=1883156 RepID=UPI003BA996D3
MKANFSSVLTILLFLIFVSCADDDDNNIDPASEVLLLQVDFMTNTFEGGKKYVFDSSVESFTISSNYQAPGDFGNIALYYDELNEMIFDGSIVWMGTGQRSFPENLINPDDFQNNTNPVPMPSEANFQTVMYDDFAYYPDTIDYSAIWNSISNLQEVTDFRNNNPNSEINLFLYTPSVGIGDPNEWDWVLFLKK